MAESGCLKDGHFQNLQVDGNTTVNEITPDNNTTVVINKFSRDPDRYYLEDFFAQLPTQDTYSTVTQIDSNDAAVNMNAKVGKIITCATDITPDESDEFVLHNKFITTNSIIIVTLLDTSGTYTDNSSLQLTVHDIGTGSCKIRMAVGATQTGPISFTIGFIIDPHIPANPNFEITGTNHDDTGCIFDPTNSGIIINTGAANDDKTILQPKGGVDTNVVSSTVLINNVGGYGASTAGAMNVDGGSALEKLRLNERIYTSAGDTIGVVDTITSATSITVSGGTEVALADDAALYVKGHAQTAWGHTTWGTEDQVIWECAIRTYSTITSCAFWAGLKKTNVPDLTTDTDEAYFAYCQDGSTVGNFTTKANLHFITSTGGTDYVTNLGIVVAINKLYKLKIIINSDRLVYIYVNGQQYGLTSTDGALGVTESTTTKGSPALSTDVNLYPFIGVLNQLETHHNLGIVYQKISKLIK